MKGYTLDGSAKALLIERGYGKAAHVPRLFDLSNRYHRLANEYLIDRSLTIWHVDPNKRKKPLFRLAPITIGNFGRWLGYYLCWSDDRNVDPMRADYIDDLLERYQKDLLNGTWLRRPTKHDADTTNNYVDVAVDYLRWAAYKGHRDEFVVSTTKQRFTDEGDTDSKGHLSKEVDVRDGKALKQRLALRMPSDEEIRTWLRGVYLRHGYVIGLMCETVLQTGLRRSEVAAFRLDYLDADPAAWHIGNPTAPEHAQLVQIEIRYGTKGRGLDTDHGDKVGPARSIKIPLHIAKKLHEYRKTQRAKQVTNWVKQVRGVKAQEERRKQVVHLFLNELTNAPETGQRLYRAWKLAPLPFKGWTVHGGRHWWACSVLWREVKHIESWSQEIKLANKESITDEAMSAIQYKIMPQLGHKRTKTSLIYLSWAMAMLDVALPELYIKAMEKSVSYAQS